MSDRSATWHRCPAPWCCSRRRRCVVQVSCHRPPRLFASVFRRGRCLKEVLRVEAVCATVILSSMCRLFVGCVAVQRDRLPARSSTTSSIVTALLQTGNAHPILSHRAMESDAMLIQPSGLPCATAASHAGTSSREPGGTTPPAADRTAQSGKAKERAPARA